VVACDHRVGVKEKIKVPTVAPQIFRFFSSEPDKIWDISRRIRNKNKLVKQIKNKDKKFSLKITDLKGIKVNTFPKRV
jgi:hypothetical protein